MTYLSIGQLAKKMGLRTSALRYYEEQGLLSPATRTQAGYRLYDETAEQTLGFIQRAQQLGFSLADIEILLEGWQEDNLSDESLIAIAESRYLALEKQVTPLLVMRHELQLFWQDLIHKQKTEPEAAHLTGFTNRICNDSLNQAAENILNLLISQSDCQLGSAKGQALLSKLQGQHLHLWQVDTAYHILIISDDPAIEAALTELAQLEANCQAHRHHTSLHHNGEGYLFIAQGEQAFIFARLFLALGQAPQP